MTETIATLTCEGRTLAVAPGQMILVTGPVGCGKSLLLQRMAGLAALPPQLSWQGPKAVQMLEEHTPPLWLAPTLGEELVFGLHPAPNAEARHQARSAWRLEALPTDTPVEALDRLQGLRLALAAMELSGTVLALLDNPTASLPLDDAELLRKDIAAWMERCGGAVVIACNRWQDWQPWVQQTWHLDMGADMPDTGTVHD